MSSTPDTAQKIALVTDSASDLTPEQRAKYNIFSVPLRVVYRNGEYRDGIDISPSEVYDRLGEELPKTSLPLPNDVVAVYEELIEQGFTHVIHICISSGLSGTYNMVRMVAAEYPQLHIEVVDTKILSMGEGFLVLECGKKLLETGSIASALAHIRTLRDNMMGVFIIRTLEYLRKGGRIGLVESVLGSMLNLKPVIFVNDEGIYQTLVKARGFNGALDALVQEVKKRFSERPVHLAVVHGQAQNEAQNMLERLRSVLNIVEGFVTQVSPVLGVHTGPSLLGLIVYETV